MPKRFLHFSIFLFLITSLSGVFMRYTPFTNSIIEYEYVLHAHSHLAILGWAFLGVFVIFLSLFWKNIKEKKHAIILTTTIFVVSSIMFLSFLYEGYATYSIIMSTLHIFVEYWAIYFIYRQLKSLDNLPKMSKHFIYASLLTLVLSTIGPFLLGYLGATGLKESAYFDMAIYFYLHFQYNGWLSLFLMGLFIVILHKHKILLSNKLLTYGFWIYFIALFPWYLSSISWTGIGIYGEILATIGNIGQCVGTVIFLIAIVKARESIKEAFSKVTIISLICTFILLFFKSVMELGLISTELSSLVFDTRPVVIGYLHLTLLGFVSLFILSQYQMIRLIDTNRNPFILGLTIFLLGFIMNELLLFVMGLITWIEAPFLSFYYEGLLAASILIFVGITLIWISICRKKKIHED